MPNAKAINKGSHPAHSRLESTRSCSRLGRAPGWPHSCGKGGIQEGKEGKQGWMACFIHPSVHGRDQMATRLPTGKTRAPGTAAPPAQAEHACAAGCAGCCPIKPRRLALPTSGRVPVRLLSLRLQWGRRKRQDEQAAAGSAGCRCVSQTR